MEYRARAIVAAVAEDPDRVDPAHMHFYFASAENVPAVVAALAAALQNADSRVVDWFQCFLDEYYPLKIDLQKDIDNLAHNIEPGDTQHAKRARRA